MRYVEVKGNGSIVTVKTLCVKKFTDSEPIKFNIDKNMNFITVEAPFCVRYFGISIYTFLTFDSTL